MEGFLFLAGLFVGATAIYFILRSKLGAANDLAAELRGKAEAIEEKHQNMGLELAAVRVQANRVSELEELLKSKDTQIITLERDRSSMATSIQERERALEEERKQLKTLKDEFKAQFAELSANALKDNSEKFLDNAKNVLALQHKEAGTDLEKRQEKIELLVKPIQEGIKAIGDVTKEMETNRVKAFTTIEEQLKKSIEHVAEVARQTGNLKNALKKPNVRGRWGEIQLKNCIELAGMEEHCDVIFQESSVSLDEERVRPDMVVRMPGGRKVTVDSKTPMDYFLQYIEAATEEEKNDALVRHGSAVKKHVSSLATTDYMQKVAGSPDFVVMFLPNESFLAMALEKEPNLMEDALNKKVLVATPGTLIGLLKVIRYGWNEEKIAVNAERIADEGRKLNTQITRFLDDYAILGEALKKASDAYDDTTRRVEKQITSVSGKLTALGAKSHKALSKKAIHLLPSGEEESADEVIESVNDEAEEEAEENSVLTGT